jgi:hypothetical protein
MEFTLSEAEGFRAAAGGRVCKATGFAPWLATLEIAPPYARSALRVNSEFFASLRMTTDRSHRLIYRY